MNTGYQCAEAITGVAAGTSASHCGEGMSSRPATGRDTAEMTPQRLWQLEMLSHGLCQECGKEAREVRIFSTGTRQLTLGAECRERQNAARRILTAKKRRSEATH